MAAAVRAGVLIHPIGVMIRCLVRLHIYPGCRELATAGGVQILRILINLSFLSST